MTTRAWNIGVSIGEREIDRRRRVIYRGAQPAIKIVAAVAGGRELRCDVIRIRRLLKIGLVTRNAGGRQSLVLAYRCAFMAVITLNRGMRSQERETVLVIFHLLNSDVPALNRVALCAIRSHLALVNVVMTVLAILAHVGKYRLYVALRAQHFFVHSS